MKMPAGVLAQHVIALGKTGAGKSSALRVLVEGLLDADKPVCIIDPKGDWWGIKSSADGKKAGFPVVVFGGEHADVPINEHSAAAVAELIATGNRSCLIDLGGWMVGERTRFFIAFASTLFKLTRGARHLVIDEVHNFAPQGKILDPDAGKMLHWANRLASEGRGKGITIIAASQRPQKVHKDFVTSCETLIAMRVIHKLDRESIKDWIDGCADPAKGREVLATLAQMKRGEAWIWSPEIDYGPERIAFPMFKTYDSFKPQSADVTKLAGWASVDLDQVKTKLAKVVEEAKANDPAALKKRIAELERQAKQQSGAADTDLVAVNKAVNQAYQDGYTDGRDRGWKDCSELARPYLANLIKGREQFVADVEHIIRLLMSTPKFHSAVPPVKVQHSPMPKTALNSLKQVKTPPTKAQHTGNVKLPRAERALLTVLAQHPEGRTKIQLSILSGYSVKSSSFSNALGALRSMGYVTAGEPIRATDEGIDNLGDYDPLPTGSALIEHWLRNLPKAEQALLQACVEQYPSALYKDQLAERSGYSVTSSSFSNALGKLRSLELVSRGADIKAREDLFS